MVKFTVSKTLSKWIHGFNAWSEMCITAKGVSLRVLGACIWRVVFRLQWKIPSSPYSLY